MASRHPPTSRPLSIVTGASSGIGRELERQNEVTKIVLQPGHTRH